MGGGKGGVEESDWRWLAEGFPTEFHTQFILPVRTRNTAISIF